MALSSSTTNNDILEAFIHNRTIRVRVMPQPVLEANLNERDVTVSIIFSGTTTTTNGSNGQRRKRVTWGAPLDEKEEEVDNDPTSRKISKLINKALDDGEYEQLQDYSCAALRKHLVTEESAIKVVKLGGICMVQNSMEHRKFVFLTQPSFNSLFGQLCNLTYSHYVSYQSHFFPHRSRSTNHSGRGIVYSIRNGMDISTVLC